MMRTSMCWLAAFVVLAGGDVTGCGRKPDYSKGTTLLLEVQPPSPLPRSDQQQLTRKVADLLQQRLDKTGDFICGVKSASRIEIWWPDSKVSPEEVTALVANTALPAKVIPVQTTSGLPPGAR